MAEETDEQRAAYLEALKVERKFYEQRGDPTDAVDAEIARLVGASSRTGAKATRLKGEGRPA